MSKESVDRARLMAQRAGLVVDFLPHSQSGKTTEKAALALGTDAANILKTLILYESEEGIFVAGIILGTNRLALKKLALLSGTKKLRFASPEQILALTGFEIGGVPPLAVSCCSRAFIDQKVLEKDFAIGAGGDDHCGMRFSPKEFAQKMRIVVADISE